jgi:hypothetical protein
MQIVQTGDGLVGQEGRECLFPNEVDVVLRAIVEDVGKCSKRCFARVGVDPKISTYWYAIKSKRSSHTPVYCHQHRRNVNLADTQRAH